MLDACDEGIILEVDCRSDLLDVLNEGRKSNAKDEDLLLVVNRHIT